MNGKAGDPRDDDDLPDALAELRCLLGHLFEEIAAQRAALKQAPPSAFLWRARLVLGLEQRFRWAHALLRLIEARSHGPSASR
jgi:hypothetical protein